MQEILPLSAQVENGELLVGGIGARELAAEHGTPLVVYCEETIRAEVGKSASIRC